MGHAFSSSILTLVLAGPLGPAGSASSIVQEKSILAVITHKAGFAKGLAHNHLVVASRYTARLEFHPDDPQVTRFQLEAWVDDLIVDPPDLQRAWYSRVHELGLLSEPFVELSDSKREKIRRAMVGRRQLDVQQHPRIAASVKGIRELDDAADAFPYEVTLALDVHDVRIEKPVRARYEVQDGRVLIEATGRFRFTDFGITPYSAMLGAVKNQDDFDIYLLLIAEPFP